MDRDIALLATGWLLALLPAPLECALPFPWSGRAQSGVLDQQQGHTCEPVGNAESQLLLDPLSLSEWEQSILTS